MQAKSQLPWVQLLTPLVTLAQGTHAAPHALVLESGTHWPLQRWKPALQVSEHTPAAEHALTPLVSVGHGMQRLPHVARSVFDAQVFPQAWKPGLHAMPQDVPLQVELPLRGTAQGEHAPPQVAVAESLTQAPLQR